MISAAVRPRGPFSLRLSSRLSGDATRTFAITAVAQEGNNLRVTWTMGSGKTNALERSTSPTGNYSTNFAEIFSVTNTIGAATNYVDLSAATNAPARYYRIRLVP